MAQEIITPPLVQVDLPLNVADLTETTMVGTGVLDVLLTTMRTHLGSQYDLERIRGPEYADVYLGAYTATLEQAINFMLSKERQGLEFKLLVAQEAQIRDEMTKTPYEIELLQAQVRNMDNQAQLVQKQIELAEKELDLKDAQIELAQQQVLLAKEQLEQAKAQTGYYEQKTISEKAQTQAGVAAPGSVIATQVDLMKAQEDGYQRNAEQQAAQIWANTWNVRRQTDEGTTADDINKLSDTSLGKVMTKLAAGVQVIL